MLRAGDDDIDSVVPSQRARTLSPRAQDLTLLGTVWVAGIVVTTLPLVNFSFGAGVRSFALDVILDAVNACIALLAAYLVHGRFLRQGRLQDLLLTHGLVLLALAGLGVTILTDTVGGAPVQAAGIWLPVAVLSVAAVLIAAAALVDAPPIRRAETRKWSGISVVTEVCLLSVLLTVISSYEDELSSFFSAGETSTVAGHPLVVAGHWWVGLWFFVASIAFAHRSSWSLDPLLRWTAPAFALAGFARVNYALFPEVHTEWLYAGDVFRTACYLLLLVGATREIRQYWNAQAGVAVLEDRRRLARELHDGVIQELAFIKSQSLTLTEPSATPVRIVSACNRALDEARAALQALGQTGDEPLGLMLHRTAQELAERHGVDLEVDLDDSVEAVAEQQHAVLRITREAVSNAVRHGKAQRVRIMLTKTGHSRCLTVTDDGTGFDLASTLASASGYGLTSMRERAELLPGTFTIYSQSGQGSVVTVTW
ncbi:sensor histidine kinase [Mycetocola sp. 2940]|uniref:sensor histidine kinase n=1 Tax=Mycetocola sp. 2940 TaxID=3156452 RepID=UPI0033975320